MVEETQILGMDVENPLLHNDLEQNVLCRNVSNVLAVLDKNRYQNSPSARIVAVTKTVGPQVINALKPLNILDIGENRVQAALPKLTKIATEFKLHWIGRLQSNKVKYIIEHVHMLHSLDRMSLAQEIDRCAGERGLALPSLIQVNIAGERQKGGIPPDEVLPFLRRIRGFSGIRVMGLMSVMPLKASEEELENWFGRMRTLFERLRDEAVVGVEMRELSMGMSNDYEIAARNGATIVRIGTALYRA